MTRLQEWRQQVSTELHRLYDPELEYLKQLDLVCKGCGGDLESGSAQCPTCWARHNSRAKREEAAHAAAL